MYTTARVVENRALGRGNFVLRLSLPDDGASLAGALPGQFVMLRGEWGRDPLLPRAFSILRAVRAAAASSWSRRSVAARACSSCARAGRAADACSGRSGGRFPSPSGAGDLLVAGGVGLAPLLWHAEMASARAGPIELFYGARTAADLVLLDEIARRRLRLHAHHRGRHRADGYASAGRVTDALGQRLPRGSPAGARVLTCGPNAMMRAVVELARAHDAAVPGLASRARWRAASAPASAARCRSPTATRPFAYACVDGPVFDAAKVVIP